MAVSDTSPMDVVRALRSQATCFTVLADACDDVDQNAAVAREEAVQLRCHAAVFHELSELGSQVRMWDEFAKRLRGLA